MATIILVSDRSKKKPHKHSNKRCPYYGIAIAAGYRCETCAALNREQRKERKRAT